MKKTALAALCLLVTGIAAQAQTGTVDATYKDYVGKYVFAPGEPVDKVDISIRDTSLAVSTDVTGVIVLKKLGVDSFAVNADGAASVAFRRDSSGHVTGLLLYTISGRAVPAKKQEAVGGE